MNNLHVLKELQTIPGVGKSIANDFYNVGIRKVADLRGKDPEMLYDKICKLYNKKIDRCMLYVCRCAVYFASTEKPQLNKLKWWNWKD